MDLRKELIGFKNHLQEYFGIELLETHINDYLRNSPINSCASDETQADRQNEQIKEVCIHTSGYITVQIIKGEYWCIHCRKPIAN